MSWPAAGSRMTPEQAAAVAAANPTGASTPVSLWSDNNYTALLDPTGTAHLIGAGGGSWGSITGTLSAQTDLQTALNAKAALASPALTGIPTAPTAAVGTSTTQLATTAFVAAVIPTEATLVGTTRALTNSDNGKILECTTTVTLTVPTGLTAGFSCIVIPSGTTSIASSGGALLNGATTTVTRTATTNAIFAIQGRASASDSYVVSGS